MGFWDKMRDVAESLPVVGNAALAVVDIARAKMENDDSQSVKDILVKDYGVHEAGNALATAASQPVVRPTLAGLAKVYTYGAARPVSTVAQQLANVQGNDVSPLFGSKEWRQAWANSREVSPGQAVVKLLAQSEDSLPGGSQDNGFQAQLGIKDASWADVARTGEKGDQRFNTGFSLASGTLDGILSWYTDPLVIAGKTAKVAKLRRTELRPGDVQAIGATDTSGLTRRQAKVRSEVDAFVTETDGYSASELMRFKAFKNNAALASAFEAADGNHALKRLVLRTAMGDTDAKLQLSQQAAHISARLDRMTTEIDDVLFADELAAPGSLFEFHNGAADLAALQREKKADERLLDFYQRILPDEDAALQAETLGVPLDSHNLGAFGSFGERPRITAGDRRSLQHERSYVIQDGVGDIPVRIQRQAVGRRGEGMVHLHDAEQAFEEMSNMLRRVRGLSAESRRKMLDGLVAAPDDNARMLSIQAIEEHVFRHIGDQLGYTHDEIEALLAKTLDERGRMIKHVKERAFSGATDANGVPVDMVILEDGTAYHRPLLETHLANQTPTLDVDHVYRVLKNNAERVGALRAGAGKSFDVVKDAGMLVNDLWKFQTLLRLGYLQRNINDNQMRLFGYLGGLDHVRTMGENIGQGIMHKLSSVSAAAARQDAVERVRVLNKQIEDSLAGRPIKYHPLDEDPKVQALVDERDKWQQVVDNGPNPDDFAPHFGQGEITEGPYTRPDAFGKRTSEYERYRAEVSGEDMWANFAGGEMDRLLNKMRSDEWVTITGSDSRYVDHYLRVVNNQFRQSEIAMRLLRGDSPEAVTAWLKSPEGRQLRRRLTHRWDSPEELVQANLENINHVIPDPAMRALAVERNLRKGDVDRMFHEGQHTRPPINAAQIGYSLGVGKTAQVYNAIRDSYFKWMSSMPDNLMGRHPIYRQMYRGRLRQLLHQADPDLRGTLTPMEQRVLDEQARVWARREMKRIMFDVSSKSNVAHWARFVAPFFAAWEDSMVKYGRLVSRDPSLIPRAWMAWTAPNDMSLVEVVDINGKPIDSEHSRVSDNEYVRIPAGFLGKKFSQGVVDIPKASLNIALQGDPFWLPGFGPMVQAPVNEIAKTRPQAEDVVSFILPYGTEDAGFLSYKKFLSSGLRNASRGQNDRMYSRMMVQVAATEAERYRQGLRDTKPTPKEIAQRTRNLYMLKVATSFTSPFSIQYKSPYQFYIDEAHRYQEKYGVNADRKFLKDYGQDFYIFSTSLSKNSTGIQATQRADKTARRLKDLIAGHPDFGWFFVGPDNTGTFSPGVYTAQQLRRVSPTSTETYRGSYSPDEALARNNAELGWIEYQKLTAKLEAIRIQRGLSSMQVKGAEDLRAIKAQWLQEAKSQPWGHDWLNDYESRDEGTVRKFLEAASAAVHDDRIASRPDIETMAEYLDARAKFQKILAARKANGGSASLTAQSNSDLAGIWAQITGILVDQNITFGDVYTRTLENDDLTARIN
jgi:hypothetical protein